MLRGARGFRITVLLNILVIHSVFFAQDISIPETNRLQAVAVTTEPTQTESVAWQDRIKNLPQTVLDVTVDVIKDTIAIHRNLFSWDSLKILGAFTPIYLISYFADKNIHKQFYNADKHKNLNQIPFGISGTIRSITFAAAMVLSSLAIVSPDPTLREVSRTFSVGYFAGLFAKNMIKKIHMRPAQRPWNEKFNPEKRAYGGFPSGHMFEATYMTMVYGLQYGLWALVPFGAYTTSLFVASIISNRHYTSQAVAGVALGALYGIAAHKVIQKNLSDKFSLDLGSNDKGDPALTFTYHF